MQEFVNNNRVAVGLLIGWLFIHFVLFMYSSESSNYSKEWYPFTDHDLKLTYDVSEFVLYGFGPMIFFTIVKLMSNK
jgi:hypothetical protein